MRAVGYVRIGVIATHAALAACSVGPVKVTDKETLPVKIAQKCGTPVEWVTVGADGYVHFEPPAGAQYDQVDCILRETKMQRPEEKLGFVGNERYSP